MNAFANINTIYIDSPLGLLELSATESALVGLHFCDAEKVGAPQRNATAPNAILLQAEHELKEYFAGSRQVFDVAIAPSGTAFQETVWQTLTDIAYSHTISYQTLAARLGKPKVIRAAASANGKNPISIIVPCHRVIGADGSLVGYGGDLWRKKRLLDLENKFFSPPSLF